MILDAELLLGIVVVVALAAPFAIIPVIFVGRYFVWMYKRKKIIAGFKDKAGADSTFEQIYQQLSEKHRPQLDAMRKSIVRKLWLVGGASVAALIVMILPVRHWMAMPEGYEPIAGTLGLLGIIFWFALVPISFPLYVFHLKRPYVLYFRENVAKSFVELLDSGLSYAVEPPERLVFSRQWEEICKSNRRKLWRVGRIPLAVFLLLIAFAVVTSSLALLLIIMLMLMVVPGALSAHNETLKRRQLTALGLPYPAQYPDTWIMEQYHTAEFDGRIPILKTTRQMIPTEKMGSPGLSNYMTGKIERRLFHLCCMALVGASDSVKFKGLFVRMKVSKRLRGFIKTERKVRRVRRRSARFIPKGEIRKMDSPAFEKDFRVGSDSQITAMQYLTADVMELISSFKNELLYTQMRFNRRLLPQNPNRISLDLVWQGNEVLMRIGNKKMFKPTLRDPMCKDSLACCYSSLTFATRFNHVITKSIKETSI